MIEHQRWDNVRVTVLLTPFDDAAGPDNAQGLEFPETAGDPAGGLVQAWL